jgi:hypothetical protein
MAHLAMRRRPGVAHDVAVRGFDLDDLGAEISENQRCQRPEDDRREIEDPDPRERSHIPVGQRIDSMAIRHCEAR